MNLKPFDERSDDEKMAFKKDVEEAKLEVARWMERKRKRMQGLRRNLIREHFPEVIMKDKL